MFSASQTLGIHVISERDVWEPFAHMKWKYITASCMHASANHCVITTKSLPAKAGSTFLKITAGESAKKVPERTFCLGSTQ